MQLVKQIVNVQNINYINFKNEKMRVEKRDEYKVSFCLHIIRMGMVFIPCSIEARVLKVL